MKAEVILRLEVMGTPAKHAMIVELCSHAEVNLIISTALWDICNLIQPGSLISYNQHL